MITAPLAGLPAPAPEAGAEATGPERRGRRLRPEPAIAAVCMIFLVGIIALPLVTMVVASLRPGDTLPFASGGFSFSSLHQALDVLATGGVLANTVIYSASSLALGLFLSIPLAYLTERTDFAWREFLYAFMFIAISIPAFALALGWLLLANPSSGMVNDLLRQFVHGNSGPLSLYNMGGLVFVAGIGITPSIWLVLVSLWRNYEGTYDQAARAAGAGFLRTFVKVTLPMMLPGIGAVVILFFMVGLQAIDIPIALGPAAHVRLLPVEIYLNVQSPISLPNYSLDAGFGLFSLALGLVLIYCYFKLLRHANAYVTVGGRGGVAELFKLRGVRRMLAQAFVVGYVIIGTVCPVGILVYASLLRYYTSPGFGPLEWTWSNFAILKSYAGFWHFFVNTVIVAGAAATVTGVLAMAIAWSHVRHPSKVTATNNVLSFVPLAIPGTIVSLALFMATLGTPLFESLLVMIVAEVAGWLPYSVRLAQAAQLQVGGELEEAARTSGATMTRAFGRVNFPLIRPAFTNAFLWVFIHATKDFSVGLILASSSTALLANVIYDAYTASNFSPAAAMMLVLIAFNVLVTVITRRRLSRSMIGSPLGAGR